MINVPTQVVVELPVDELGLIILRDFIATHGWNEWNYVNEAQQNGGYKGEALNAIAEAFGWLHARGLIASDPTQHSNNAIIVTRTGHRIAAEGPDSFYATERLQRGSLHLLIEQVARPQFLIGQYELGVFAAMKAIEVRTRKLAGFSDDVIGVDLMNKAFGPGGPLRDPAVVKAEAEGTRSLFVGAYAVFRNPAGHREVDYGDVAEAAEAVQTASLLMRILDRVEARVSS